MATSRLGKREAGLGQLETRIAAMLGRHWRLWLLLFWVVACGLMITGRWQAIHWFSLSDTDDNMRIMQVRAWLNGQDWFDLRQHRLDPPAGANLHWSRLVDLPLAALIVSLKPLLGGALAEKSAVAIAPLLPMLVALGAMAATARRLVAPNAYLLAMALLMCAHSTRMMWAPLRIDHHGWQLAMLALVILSFAVRSPARAGTLAGAASALSLAIGLEMLIYLALAGAMTASLWIRDPAQRPRLFCYGATLAAGTAFGYLAFASWDNRLPVCDALSPVWLSVMLAAGALAVLLTIVPLGSRAARLGAAAIAGALLAAGFAYFWPDCLGRPEAVSPELDRLWLSKVREAKPLYDHDLTIMLTVAAIPVVGLVGYGVMLWRLRAERDRAMIWAALGLMCAAATALLLWQTRAGPAAQLLAIPGATALGWLIMSWTLASKRTLICVFGTVLAFLLISGLGPQYLAKQIPEKPSKAMQKVGVANRSCPTLPALRPVALHPKGLVLTFVDLGPRLIAVTHHDAIAGPYHRNGDAILDIHRSFRGSVENARRTVLRRDVDYVLICPGMSESTVYRSEAPKGFYAEIASGRIPAWLEPVELPSNSPFRMWRVIRD